MLLLGLPMNYTRLLYSMLAATGLVLAAGSSSAALLESTASPFTGDPLAVSISVDDEADPGSLVITLSVAGSDPTGDLRGFFAHVADESLLAGLSVSGTNVSNATFDADGVINLGGGNNLNGGGSPCPCDFGLEIGSPGIGFDDIQSVTFTLSHASESLDASLLDGQLFGVRATSVGAPGQREGSSKLVGVVPEPSTALLLLVGLAGLSGSRRR